MLDIHKNYPDLHTNKYEIQVVMFPILGKPTPNIISQVLEGRLFQSPKMR